MTPTQIRNALIDEARRLEGEGAVVPAQALLVYANLSTDDEMIRLRFLLVVSALVPAVADAQTSDDAHTSSD